MAGRTEWKICNKDVLTFFACLLRKFGVSGFTVNPYNHIGSSKIFQGSSLPLENSARWAKFS